MFDDDWVTVLLLLLLFLAEAIGVLGGEEGGILKIVNSDFVLVLVI